MESIQNPKNLKFTISAFNVTRTLKLVRHSLEEAEAHAERLSNLGWHDIKITIGVA